jgi:hypothetical protein
MCIHKLDVPGFDVYGCACLFEVIEQLLLFVQPVDDLLDSSQHPPKVHAGELACEAVPLELFGIARQACGSRQHPGRDAAIIRARSP